MLVAGPKGLKSEFEGTEHKISGLVCEILGFTEPSCTVSHHFYEKTLSPQSDKIHCNPLQGSIGKYRENPVMKTGKLQ